jgi:hypothetical protein
MDPKTSVTPRCVECRTEIPVPDNYAHGDHVKCSVCGARHRVQRGDTVRLVLADIAPLKEALRAAEQRIERLDDEMRGARRSIGLGANGIFLGVLYVVWQIALRERTLTVGVIVEAALIAVVSGVLLELANHLFFAKRHRILRLSEEVEQARQDAAQIRQKLRDATRG